MFNDWCTKGFNQTQNLRLWGWDLEGSNQSKININFIIVYNTTMFQQVSMTTVFITKAIINLSARFVSQTFYSNWNEQWQKGGSARPKTGLGWVRKVSYIFYSSS